MFRFSSPSSPSATPSLALFEGLEDRRLLSGDPSKFHVLMPMIDLVGLQMAVDRSGGSTTTSSSSTKASTADVPNIVGDWAGKVKATAFLFFTRKISFNMHVADQGTDTITGSVGAQGRTYNGTIPITWHGRAFTMKYNDSKISGTLNGTVNEAGDQITGKFKGKGYGVSGSGTIKLDKVVT
jgi:hypothetical protein